MKNETQLISLYIIAGSLVTGLYFLLAHEITLFETHIPIPSQVRVFMVGLSVTFFAMGIFWFLEKPSKYLPWFYVGSVLLFLLAMSLAFPRDLVIFVYSLGVIFLAIGSYLSYRKFLQYVKWFFVSAAILLIIGINISFPLIPFFVWVNQNGVLVDFLTQIWLGIQGVLPYFLVFLGSIFGTYIAYRTYRYIRPSSDWHVQHAKHRWEILKTDGSLAKTSKKIYARALRDGVREWYDIFGGSDINFLDDEYTTPNGVVSEVSLIPEGKQLLVLLHDTYNLGEKIEFESRRVLRDTFIQKSAWVQTSITSESVDSLEMEVILPRGLSVEGNITLEEVRSLGVRKIILVDALKRFGSKKRISYRIEKPKYAARYVIRWRWKRKRK